MENVFPGDSHTFASDPVPLTLDQMRRIDLGEKLRVIVEDFSFGADELFYQDAVSAGVTAFIEDGREDGDETVDLYVIPTWGVESIQDVLHRYFPMGLDDEGNPSSLWTPEFDGTNPPTWHEHYLSDIAWWNIYLTQPDAGGTPLRELSAVAGSAVLFRFNRDSDRDGYQDIVEERHFCSLPAADPDSQYCGTAQNLAGVYPRPQMLAGTVATRSGDEVTVLLKLANLGTFDAYGLQAVMYAPDDTVTIGNNTVGGNGRVRPGRQVAVGSLVLPPDLTEWTNSTAQPYSGGNFVGSANVTYTLSVSMPGVVGQGSTSVSWDDGAGHSGTLDLGGNYHAPLPIDLPDGLQVGFDTGTIASGDSFGVPALTPLDTFTYAINTEPFTKPVVVVSYNDPHGNHRFITPVELGDLAEDLMPYAGQMTAVGGVQIVPHGAFDPVGDNTTSFVINSPHPVPIEDAHLYVDIVGDGTVVANMPFTLTVEPGPVVVPWVWNTSVFSEPYTSTINYLMMAFWTDAQDNIIDSAARPLDTFAADRVARASTPVVEWNVGTLYRPEAFSHAHSLIGTSHTEGIYKQSTNYRMGGSAGQPTAGTTMSSTNYSLVPGYWPRVRSLDSGLREPVRAGTEAANDAVERYPSHVFAIADVGPLPLHLRTETMDQDVTVWQEPTSKISQSEFGELGMRLDPDHLDLGPFDRSVSVVTDDPYMPVIQFHLAGEVQPSREVVFVHDYQSDVRPLTKIAHVNGPRSPGDPVRFAHGISGDTSTLQPLLVYAGDNVTLLGKGAAIDDTGSIACQSPGDSDSTDLWVTDSSADRQDYVMHYGYQADLPGGGGQATYQVPVPNRNYAAMALDLLIHELVSDTISLSLDVGADGSAEWSYSGMVSPTQDILHIEGLETAVNAYLDSIGGPEVMVPMRLTTDVQGGYFLTNLRGSDSTDYDLSLPAGISVSDSTPSETDIVQVCAQVGNDGQGPLRAATVSFFDGDPADNGAVIGHALVTDLTPEGGAALGCVDWDTTGYAGNVTVWAYVDVTDQIVEHDEGNNAATTTVLVLSRADLQVAGVGFLPFEGREGEAISATATISNTGQTDALQQTVAFYHGNPESGGVLIGTADGAVQAGDAAEIAISWTATGKGQQAVYALADSAEQVNESDETNNSGWAEVYVGISDEVYLDCGSNPDPLYEPTVGYGYLTGVPVVWDNTPVKTARWNADGMTGVEYQFDYLLPSAAYHLDLTLYDGDGIGRVEEIWIDDLDLGVTVSLTLTEPYYVSLLLDPAFYQDHTLVPAVKSENLAGAVVSEIAVREIEYVYLDSGTDPLLDPPYDPEMGYGYLNGYGSAAWGSTPLETVRTVGAAEVQYRFDNLKLAKSYRLNLTLYEEGGTGRQQVINVDGEQVGGPYTLGPTPQYVVVQVPASAYSTDGSIIVGIERTDGNFAVVSEIALEEVTIVHNGTLNLEADLQGRLDESGGLFSAWAGGEMTQDCRAGTDGACSMVLPTGSYSVTAVMTSYLESVWEGANVVAGESLSLPVVELRGGDANGDCAVNILDLSRMGNRFNSECGDTGWDPASDINGDCVVNILDLTMAGSNFNETCPTPWPASQSPEGEITQPSPVTATVTLQPSRLDLEPGTTEYITVAVSGATDLYGAEVHLAFDPTMIRVLDADPAQDGVQVDLGDLLQPDFVTVNRVDNGAGVMDLALTQVRPSPASKGEGTLAVLAVQAVREGHANLSLVGALLADGEGMRIAVDTGNGTVVVGTGFHIYLPIAVR